MTTLVVREVFYILTLVVRSDSLLENIDMIWVIFNHSNILKNINVNLTMQIYVYNSHNVDGVSINIINIIVRI